MAKKKVKPVRKNAKRTYTDAKTGKFKPGNPGRPKGTKNFTTKIREVIELISKEQKIDYESEMARKVLTMFMEGDPRIVKLVWNYFDGMPESKMDVTTDGEKISPIQVYLPKRDDQDDVEALS